MNGNQNVAKPKGGKAFPLTHQGLAVQAGMDRRFYAACAALSGIIASPSDHLKPDGKANGSVSDNVRTAYSYADWMIKLEDE